MGVRRVLTRGAGLLWVLMVLAGLGLDEMAQAQAPAAAQPAPPVPMPVQP